MSHGLAVAAIAGVVMVLGAFLAHLVKRARQLGYELGEWDGVSEAVTWVAKVLDGDVSSVDWAAVRNLRSRRLMLVCGRVESLRVGLTEALAQCHIAKDVQQERAEARVTELEAHGLGREEARRAAELRAGMLQLAVSGAHARIDEFKALLGRWEQLPEAPVLKYSSVAFGAALARSEWLAASETWHQARLCLTQDTASAIEREGFVRALVGLDCGAATATAAAAAQRLQAKGTCADLARKRAAIARAQDPKPSDNVGAAVAEAFEWLAQEIEGSLRPDVLSIDDTVKELRRSSELVGMVQVLAPVREALGLINAFDDERAGRPWPADAPSMLPEVIERVKALTERSKLVAATQASLLELYRVLGQWRRLFYAHAPAGEWTREPAEVGVASEATKGAVLRLNMVLAGDLDVLEERGRECQREVDHLQEEHGRAFELLRADTCEIPSGVLALLKVGPGGVRVPMTEDETRALLVDVVQRAAVYVTCGGEGVPSLTVRHGEMAAAQPSLEGPAQILSTRPGEPAVSDREQR